MHHQHTPLLFFFISYITIFSAAAAAAADHLKNPDFEIPPANITANATSSIPGWSLNGTVWYVASPGGGHAVQLGRNGKINQTMKARGLGSSNGVLDYVVSFSVGAQSIECANNRTALNVALRDSRDFNVSRLIYLQQNSMWERHSLKLPQMGGGGGGDEFLHIHVQSLGNATCWPLIDAFTVNTNPMPIWYDGNLVSNGGFEVGPALCGDGIILNEEEEAFYSPLQEWSIIGSVRYIDSRHYKVPRGKAALELLTGDPSGVRQDLSNLATTHTHTLNFTMGDANDSCVADFVVHVQVGWSVYNFTMKSSGTGSAVKQSLMFRVDQHQPDQTTSISFYTFNETRNRDGVLCGPLLDHISLTASSGESLQLLPNGLFLIFIFFLTLVLSS